MRQRTFARSYDVLAEPPATPSSSSWLHGVNLSWDEFEANVLPGCCSVARGPCLHTVLAAGVTLYLVCAMKMHQEWEENHKDVEPSIFLRGLALYDQSHQLAGLV